LGYAFPSQPGPVGELRLRPPGLFPQLLQAAGKVLIAHHSASQKNLEKCSQLTLLM
jgi:hypothetical protein